MYCSHVCFSPFHVTVAEKQLPGKPVPTYILCSWIGQWSTGWNSQSGHLRKVNCLIHISFFLDNANGQVQGQSKENIWLLVPSFVRHAKTLFKYKYVSTFAYSEVLTHNISHKELLGFLCLIFLFVCLKNMIMDLMLYTSFRFPEAGHSDAPP